jgi:hypothetical protein
MEGKPLVLLQVNCRSILNKTEEFWNLVDTYNPDVITGTESILSKEGKCWPEFYKYVKRRKGYRENIPAIKDCNGRLITDPIQTADSLNYY